MDKSGSTIKITGIIMAVLGGSLLLLAILTGGKFNAALPLTFFLLSGMFFIGAFSFTDKWNFTSLLIVPAALFCTFGLIFLLNLLTGDWSAWAYAWLLLLAAIGIGLLAAGKLHEWGKVVNLVGWCLALGGLTFFGIFGVIAGGLVIQIIVPILLVAAGLSLRWLGIGDLINGKGRFASAGAINDHFTSADSANSPLTNAQLVDVPTGREIEVMRLIENGLTNQQIAEALSVSSSTVKTHINNLYAKLGVKTRAQAIKRAHEFGLL